MTILTLKELNELSQADPRIAAALELAYAALELYDTAAWDFDEAFNNMKVDPASWRDLERAASAFRAQR